MRLFIEKTIHGSNGSFAELDSTGCWYVNKEKLLNCKNGQAIFKIDINKHNLKDLSDDTPVYSGVGNYEEFTGTPEYVDKKTLMQKAKEFLRKNNFKVAEREIRLIAELSLMVCRGQDIEKFIDNELKLQ